MNEVNEYLSLVPEPKRVELEHIRKLVKELVPDAEESITYAMPTFKYKGKPLIYYAAFKNHMSIFPTAGPSEQLKDELKDYKVAKGTIQFTESKPLPESLIKKIIQCRLNTILGK